MSDTTVYVTLAQMVVKRTLSQEMGQHIIPAMNRILDQGLAECQLTVVQPRRRSIQSKYAINPPGRYSNKDTIH